MEIVEKLLEARRWQGHCLRSNIVSPEDIVLHKKTKIALVENNSPQPKKSKIDRELVKAIEDIAPEWWGEETRICINRNVQCKRHKDGNKGHSYILWLGDFTGGALLFDDGTKVEEKHQWHRISGQIYHWNEPRDGTKYSIIIYTGNGRPKKTELISQRCRQKQPASSAPETTANTIDG